jgi:hypothetical protein
MTANPTPQTCMTLPITNGFGRVVGVITVTVEGGWYTVRDTGGEFRMKSTREAHAFQAAFEAAGWGVRVTRRRS